MAKKLILTCIGLLLAVPALGVPVDPEAPDGIAAYFFEGEKLWILCSDGTTYYTYSHDDFNWQHHGENLPVPLNQIADWGVFFLVTKGGEYWRSPLGSGTTWSLIETFPCSPGQVGTKSKSLNDLKARFR
jgi:hypothetical protein